MLNKIISINIHQSNFLEAIAVVAKLILTIEGSDDIGLILHAIKTHNFNQEFFFCDEEGMPMDLDYVWKALAKIASNNTEKQIFKAYSNSCYDHKIEINVSEWIIFSIMQGQWPIYKTIKTLVDAGKVDKAKQILKLHKEAVLLSKKIEQHFSNKQTELSKADSIIFHKSHGLVGYNSSVRDLNKFIVEAKAFLKIQQ